MWWTLENKIKKKTKQKMLRMMELHLVSCSRRENKQALTARCPVFFSHCPFLVRSSHHVGVLVLQLVQLFALLPQKQDSLFPECGLDFTHSDQGAKVFHLRADFRHVQASHVVDVLTQPSRLFLSVF